MTEERYVAALEISSSKIIGAIGKPLPGGKLDVIAIQQVKGKECVRRGWIQNIDETYTRINQIINNIEHKTAITPRQVQSVFIGLSGRSMRSISVEQALELPPETIINEETLARLENQARQQPIDASLEIIDCVPRKYIVNRSETDSPKGSIGNHISATYDLIVARNELRKNIERTLDKCEDIKVEGYIVTALAAAHLILTDDQKRLGCMLVDMGAETTTVTIYRHGSLCYYATIPMGGRNITRDITSLNVLEDSAEEIKLQSGNALRAETRSTLNLNGLKLSEVNDLVCARSEEIVANIIEQVAYANLTFKDLPGGIVIIGGASKLNGIDELLHKLTKLNVRRGELPDFVKIGDSKLPLSEIIEVVSILYSAAMKTDANCLAVPQREELPVTGEANPDEEPYEEVPQTTKKRHRHYKGISDAMKKLASILTPKAEDDEDDEIV